MKVEEEKHIMKIEEVLILNQKTILESIQPNFDFFAFRIFATKLGHFKVKTILSYAKSTQA
jgi:hypothetical protein